MDRRTLGILLLIGAASWWYVTDTTTKKGTTPSPANPSPCPGPGPCPTPTPQPKPKPKPKPWGPREGILFPLPTTPVGVIEAKVGGRIAPDGTEIQCDLPGDLHRKNTASKGLGNCVFTSIHHSAVFQNVPQLVEFPKYLIGKGIPGGGYPGKVKDLIPKISADRGMPEPMWLQVEGADCFEMMKLACLTGRMPSCTYSKSPTGRYNGGSVSHMVSIPHCTDQWCCVLDNNYIGEDAYEWMTPAEFARVKPTWCVILLNPPPPPPPRAPKKG